VLSPIGAGFVGGGMGIATAIEHLGKDRDYMNNTSTIYSLHESYKDIIRRIWLKQKRTAQVFYEGTRFPG
jgi:hypothetical protein